MRALRAGLILGLLTGHVLSVGEADPCISQMPEIAGIEQLMDAVQRAFTRGRFAVVGLWPTATQQASASESAAGVTDLELVLRASQTANKQMLLDVCRNLRYLIDGGVEVAFTHSSAVHTKYLGSGLDVPPAVVVIYRDHSGKEESAVLTAQQLSHVINQPPHEAAGFLPYSEIYRFIVTTATPTVGYVPAELHNITSAESKATGEQVWPAQSNQGVVALSLRCALPKLFLFTEFPRSLAERDAIRDLQRHPGRERASEAVLRERKASHSNMLTTARQRLQKVAQRYQGSLVAVEASVDPNAEAGAPTQRVVGGGAMEILGFNVSDVASQPAPQSPVLMYVFVFAGYCQRWDRSGEGQHDLDSWVGAQLNMLEDVAASDVRGQAFGGAIEPEAGEALGNDPVAQWSHQRAQEEWRHNRMV